MKMTDLGIKDDITADAPVSVKKEEPKVRYPTLYIRSEKPLDIPDGEFTVMIKGKRVSMGANEREGEKPSYTCDIEVREMGECESCDGEKGEEMPDVKGMVKGALRKKLGKMAEMMDE